ncbi:5-hydroxytryptamine receptor 1 [Holothuria leucospilota]|uniref:5-hydroxytryptamine receptor 1 n=1 Tax=Holothuria leucospilota TaxID=206669 RepID=A0A9Q1C7W6_HOLLE|nr:5-hydroxytryptamine receptor 1 [Holothuria leucospilota]
MVICKEQTEWFANYSMEDGKHYHRHPILFGLEALSLLVIMVLGIVTNISIVGAILRVPSLRRNMNNILIINLAIMDLSASIGSMPFSFYDLFEEGYLICFPLICRIHGIFAILACFGNFSAVVLISIFRCISIVGLHKITIKRRHVFMMIAAGWLCASAMVIPPFTGSASTSVYTHGTHHCSPSWGDSCLYYTSGVALVYCITIPTLVVSYGLITLTIKRNADRLGKYIKRGQQPAPPKGQFNDPEITYQEETEDFDGNVFDKDSGVSNPVFKLHPLDQVSTISERLDSNHQETQCSFKEIVDDTYKRRPSQRRLPQYRRYDKRVALSGALLVLTTTICWTPYFIVHSCSVEKTPSHGLEVFTMWLAYLNAALDPIIYTMLNEKIRNAVFQQFRSICIFLRK